MYQWKIKDMVLEFDFDDEIMMEKYESAMMKVYERCDELSKRLKSETISRKEHIRMQCEIVQECFKTLFDSKVVVCLFEGKNNLKDAIDIFGSFVDFALSSIKESNDHISAVLAKYSGKK